MADPRPPLHMRRLSIEMNRPENLVEKTFLEMLPLGELGIVKENCQIEHRYPCFGVARLAWYFLYPSFFRFRRPYDVCDKIIRTIFRSDLHIVDDLRDGAGSALGSLSLGSDSLMESIQPLIHYAQASRVGRDWEMFIVAAKGCIECENFMDYLYTCKIARERRRARELRAQSSLERQTTLDVEQEQKVKRIVKIRRALPDYRGHADIKMDEIEILPSDAEGL
ncbi:hypothetical protein SUNI508_07758 [Seiridium unicorne]|uniref:Uncharacterized protein n=1 Tax=Seiridium unicorne TaxID=138068 RepID=A0ABR2UWC7_9PEZI